MSDFKELVKNLYTSKNRELTEDKLKYIETTYGGGKEEDFVKNFYTTVGEDLPEEKFNYIKDTYLKKKRTCYNIFCTRCFEGIRAKAINAIRSIGWPRITFKDCGNYYSIRFYKTTTKTKRRGTTSARYGYKASKGRKGFRV